MDFDANALVGDDDRCCFCREKYFPGQNVTVYYPCRHPLHATCYAPLSRTRFRAKCPLDNLSGREVRQFTISADIVDPRVHEPTPEEVLPERTLGCTSCRKPVPSGSYYRFCRACYSPYHSLCAQLAFQLNNACNEESCSSAISSMDDFGGLLNVSGGGPGGAAGPSTLGSDSGSDDGGEVQEEGEDEEQELFQFDL